MSKYTDEQLKEMALDVLYAYHSFDQRFEPFLGIMCHMTGLQPGEVMIRIQEYANMEV